MGRQPGPSLNTNLRDRERECVQGDKKNKQRVTSSMNGAPVSGFHLTNQTDPIFHLMCFVQCFGVVFGVVG